MLRVQSHECDIGQKFKKRVESNCLAFRDPIYRFLKRAQTPVDKVPFYFRENFQNNVYITSFRFLLSQFNNLLNFIIAAMPKGDHWETSVKNARMPMCGFYGSETANRILKRFCS